jgi:hypothetical protein
MDNSLLPEQMRALCLIAAGRTKPEVAKECNVSLTTIERWYKLPDFKQVLRKAASDIYDQAIAELCVGAKLAAIELKNIISDKTTPARVKVQAISVLLSVAAKAKDNFVEDRLEMLEKLVGDEK